MVGGNWTEAQLFELQYAQNEKTMYIVHPDRKPLKLECAGPTSWDLKEPTFTDITFSTTNNYPSAVCFYQQRLIFAATNADPQSVWGSVVGDFEDFTVGSAGATDAFAFDIAMSRSERIRWLFPRQFDILGKKFVIIFFLPKLVVLIQLICRLRLRILYALKLNNLRLNQNHKQFCGVFEMMVF